MRKLMWLVEWYLLVGDCEGIDYVDCLGNYFVCIVWMFVGEW